MIRNKGTNKGAGFNFPKLTRRARTLQVKDRNRAGYSLWRWAPGRTNAAGRARFVIGDSVRVKEDFVPGHVRMPAYIRGKTGVVVAESPAYSFPDAHAHGVQAKDEPTYDVAFRSEDLWPNGAEAALVHVGVFQSYLERA